MTETIQFRLNGKPKTLETDGSRTLSGSAWSTIAMTAIPAAARNSVRAR